MKTLLRVATAAWVLCALSSGPLRADSLWSGDDTIFRLQASGTNRSFVVERASKDAAGQGLAAGMVVFRGKRDGNAYVGTMFDPAKGCTPDGRAVRGRVAGELSVVLEPQPQKGCEGVFGDRLELRFIGDAGVALPPEPAVEEPAPKAAAQPEADVAAKETTDTVEPAVKAVAKPEAKPAQKAAIKAKAPSSDIPAAACHSKAAATGLSMASCQGLLAGLRMAEGADAAAEAERAAAIAGGTGLSVLVRAVDTRCYPDAKLRDYNAGMAATVTGLASSKDLGQMCLDLVDAAHRVPASVRLAAMGAQTGPQTGPLEGTVWTLDPAGGSCRGKTVLRLTRAGLFQGRYGAEKAAENSVVSDWAETGDGLSATIAVYSEIVTAADVILTVAAKRTGDALELRIDRARVTPESRYSNAPVYAGDSIASIYYPCEP